MRESRTYGSMRGALGNERPYRDRWQPGPRHNDRPAPTSTANLRATRLRAFLRRSPLRGRAQHQTYDTAMTRDPVPSSAREGSLLTLAVLALVAGAAAGLVGAVFRLTLAQADQLRIILISWTHGQAAVGFLILVITCGAATGLAAWLVRRFSPQASGSGIPHAEAVLHGQLPPAPYGLAPVKSVGGVLAIGSGLALGREGPSVQMGASIAVFLDAFSAVAGQIGGCCWRPEQGLA